MPGNGPAAPGTASTFSVLAGGIYNSTPETLTNGQQSALQLDANGRLLVDAAVVFPYDENWGVVGATTLRTAAEIGNATGAADFNFGVVGAQTLRVASQIGNATGAADFGAGAATAQTLRVTASNFPTTVDTNYGVVGASTLRSDAQIGNATGAADFNAGATTAQTLRVAANLYSPNGTAYSATNPLPVTVDTVPGTAVDDFKQAVGIAINASDTHFYTVTAGKTFYFDQVIAAASGSIQFYR